MRKILSVVLSFGLLFQQSGLVYAVGELNLANYLSSMPKAIIQPDRFRPPQLRYISYDIKSNDFKLLLDKGDIVGNGLKPFPTQEEEVKLFNYFLIGLALPNDTFWVNLRPDAAENIIDPLLEKTDIGRIPPAGLHPRPPKVSNIGISFIRRPENCSAQKTSPSPPSPGPG